MYFCISALNVNAAKAFTTPSSPAGHWQVQSGRSLSSPLDFKLVKMSDSPRMTTKPNVFTLSHWLFWLPAEDVLARGRPCTHATRAIGSQRQCRNSTEISRKRSFPHRCSFSLYIGSKYWPCDWLPARGYWLYFHFCTSVAEITVRSIDQTGAATVKTLEFHIVWLLTYYFNPSAVEHLHKHTPFSDVHFCRSSYFVLDSHWTICKNNKNMAFVGLCSRGADGGTWTILSMLHFHPNPDVYSEMFFLFHTLQRHFSILKILAFQMWFHPHRPRH